MNERQPDSNAVAASQTPAASSESGSGDTKERILDAAERLFADHGFAETSLRTITGTAGANLAAVSYHFGSKDALIEAVFHRRLGPLNRERLDILDALERDAGEAGPDLEPILEAFLGPALRLGNDPAGGGRVFMRLLGHTINQPSEKFREILIGQFSDIVPRFTGALGKRLPHLDAADVFWRFLFTIGAMAHTMTLAGSIKKITGGLCDAEDTEAVIGHLIPFLAAGMRAPASEPSGTDS